MITAQPGFCKPMGKLPMQQEEMGLCCIWGGFAGDVCSQPGERTPQWPFLPSTWRIPLPLQFEVDWMKPWGKSTLTCRLFNKPENLRGIWPSAFLGWSLSSPAWFPKAALVFCGFYHIKWNWFEFWLLGWDFLNGSGQQTLLSMSKEVVSLLTRIE